MKAPGDGCGFEWQITDTAIAAKIDNIIDFPEPQAKHPYEATTLLLLGGESKHVQSSHIVEIKTLFPNARTEVTPSASHWLRVEKPAEVTAMLRVLLTG